MVSRRRLTTLLAAFVAFAAVAAFSGPAEAALAISLSMTDLTNGGTFSTGPTPIASGSAFTQSQTVGQFTASVSSSPIEGAASSDLNSTTIDIKNAGGVSPSTLQVDVTVTGYNLPSETPLLLSSSASGTSSNGLLGQQAILQSWADAGDVAFGMTTTTGPQNGTLPANAPPTQTYVFAPQDAQVLFNRTAGSPYSLTQRFSVTLSNGSSATLTLVTAATSVVPEPGSMAMTFLALPLLGVGYRLFRRRGE